MVKFDNRGCSDAECLHDTSMALQEQTADYIRDLSVQLAGLARNGGLTCLASMLDLVVIEANKLAQKSADIITAPLQ
jgi:hypothetical protein